MTRILRGTMCSQTRSSPCVWRRSGQTISFNGRGMVRLFVSRQMGSVCWYGDLRIIAARSSPFGINRVQTYPRMGGSFSSPQIGSKPSVQGVRMPLSCGWLRQTSLNLPCPPVSLSTEMSLSRLARRKQPKPILTIVAGVTVPAIACRQDDVDHLARRNEVHSVPAARVRLSCQLEQKPLHWRPEHGRLVP